MSPTTFEVRGRWRLRELPDLPEPWMARGREYVVVLRRASTRALPEAEIRDAEDDAVLGTYPWPRARELFAAREPARRKGPSD